MIIINEYNKLNNKINQKIEIKKIYNEKETNKKKKDNYVLRT